MSLCRSFLSIFIPFLSVISLFHGLALGAVLDESVPDERRTVELKLGQSKIITTQLPFTRVAIAAEEVADILVLSPREAYIYGKTLGYTSVILWENGKGKTMLDVLVSLDLTGLKEKFHELYPDQQIEVYGSETGIVLAGAVSGPEIVEQAIRLAQAYLPKEASGTMQEGGTGISAQTMRITNLLTVSGIQQVMLEVKFAELSRTTQKDMQAGIGLSKLNHVNGRIGVDNVFSTADITGPELFTLPGGIVGAVKDVPMDVLLGDASAMLLNFSTGTANIFLNIDNFTTALRLLENEGLARILAEPRLVTLSGHEASFLAGGEFPIPVPDDDGITITYKQFGVSLVFTPVILSNGEISLNVAPSVSEIASTSIIPAGIQGTNFIVPNLATRKLETTVELHDGQTLALAGLLQENLRETVSKIPGLGDIPILGALFRSSSYQQQKTDLLITVTPRLVKPVSPEDIEYPGENIKLPTDYEFYLEGKLEGERNGRESAQTEGGLEGEFGHQPLSTK